MRLKNVLIVVKDIERSKRFYQDLFHLGPLTDFDGNVILTEGLVLQERSIWETLIQKKIVCGDSDAELYFEENNMDDFIKRLEAYPEPVRYLNKLTEHDWGQRVVRIYDPDGHVIEVGEAMEFVVKKFQKAGMSLEEISKKTQFPIEQVKGICGTE